MNDNKSNKVIIGAAEYVRLPAWQVQRLRAKVDTGARSSALHVENLKLIGRTHVAFEIILGAVDHPRRLRVEAPIARRSEVRSSNGKTEMRYFVTTTVEIGPVSREVEVSLTQRGNMRYRMLLGRTALRGQFLVDPGRRFVATGKSRAEKSPRPRRRTEPDRTESDR